MSYSYAHYAILEQAKKMIADGVLGKIHTIAAEYPQEWVGLNTALRGKDGLTWRVDPAICGPSGVIADIGTHAVSYTHLDVYKRQSPRCSAIRKSWSTAD